ncbi:8980_t:CDS:2 [Gigaspora margarita]|uniref:8980_t:CDS:1 n=1 Tax=Gigaspora margarita TaxID=4874 RepID=A0ABN7UXB3_GIGMA|nr:8980_t:CDS:2 [Gigaspora margarita]
MYSEWNIISDFPRSSRALGLLDDTNKYEQCFAEAISYNCTPGQLRLPFCHLILEGMAAQTTWQNYHELLSEDYINRMNNLQQGVNKSLVWIATFLEEHSYNIKQCGLSQPHAILCPLNVEVNFINDTILQQLEGDETNLYSVDNLADDESNNIFENQRYQRTMVTTELLNSFNASGVPKYCLTLKRECVATIMRNLSLRDKLYKNSRVIVTNIGHRLITIKNPIIDSYSSIFNSSQGLTLDKVALDLCTPVFSHSQLYIALT